MKVIDILNNKNGEKFSVEVLPPITGGSINELFKYLDPLAEVIRYVNVTYHAEEIVEYIEDDGCRFPISRRIHPGTTGIAGAIQRKYESKGIEAVPHVICTSFTKYDIEEYLQDLNYLGINNELALRGDVLKGLNGEKAPFIRPNGGYAHASELIEHIVNLRKGEYAGAEEGNPIDFCVGAACYLEGHPEYRHKFKSFDGVIEDELHWLNAKVRAGADYLVTQMFFDNHFYRNFLEKGRNLGINVPIVPGIKPLTTSSQIESLPSVFGCSIPEELKESVVKCGDDKKAVREVGIDWCVRQCEDLFDYGVPAIHFFGTSGMPFADGRSSVQEVIERIRED
ncbi:methylenetetrahydrofolate reductase, partial [Candidatus Bathyarchaeota archaeon]|nr:methylenetetrahydrofolate reductase [Candidatus Bathyarchaeota archaeon]